MTVADAPGSEADQVVPPSVEVSVLVAGEAASRRHRSADAVITIDAGFCQAAQPPETVGAVGAVRSSRTVACTQLGRRPTLSTARNRTASGPRP